MAKKITDETLKFNIVVNGDAAQKEYKNLEKQQHKLINTTADLEQQAEKLRAANKENTDEYKQLTQQIKETQSELTSTEAKMSKLTKEIGLNNLSTKQLSAESKKLKTIMKELDPSTSEWKQYNQELAAITNRQFELRKELRDTSRELGYQDSAITTLTSGFATMFSGLKSGNFADVKTGFADIKSGIGGATKAALAFIATPIGATIAALAGIGLAAKSWFDYNSAVVESLRLTQQITGLTDQAADQARIRGEALSETFGVDFKETMETAATLAQQFDISFTEAFDSIEDGLVRGQKNNDEFFDSLKEYPVLFNQAGFSVKEFASVVEAGYDLKIYSDKLPDAIKEASLSLTEQTKATRDALTNAFGASFTNDILKRVRTGETSVKDALAEISAQADKTGLNMQQNAQLTADVFKGAGEDAGGAIKVFEALNVALGENQRSLTESERLTQEQVKATTELKQVSSALFSTGDKGFGLLIDKAKLFGTKMLVDILKAGINVYNWFVDLNNESRVFSGILKTLGVIATAPFKIIGEAISLVKNQFKSLGTIVEGIFTFDMDKIKEGFNQGLSNIGESITNLKNKAVEDAKAINDAFSGNNKFERKTLDDFVTTETTVTKDKTAKPTNTYSSEQDAKAEAFKKAEEEITRIILAEREKRRIDALTGINKELALIDQKYAADLEKYKEHGDKIEELEKLRDEEKEALKLQREAELADKLKSQREQRELEEEALRLEKEALAAQTEEEKMNLLLERTQFIASEQLRIEEEKELARLNVIGATEAEISEVKKRYLLENKKLKDEIDKKSFENEQTLTKARLDNYANLFGNITSLLGKNTAAGKAAAIAQSTINTYQGITEVWSTKSTLPEPFATISRIANTAVVLASGLQAVSSIKQTSTPGFEEGLYPVTRAQDGKVFNASFAGAPTTQIVGTPKTFLAGEMPEMIIDPATFKKMDPNVTDYILQLAGRRPLRGFETGKYPSENQDQITATSEPSINTLSEETVVELINTMKNLKATVIYTLTDEIKRRELADKLDQTIEASKN